MLCLSIAPLLSCVTIGAQEPAPLPWKPFLRPFASFGETKPAPLPPDPAPTVEGDDDLASPVKAARLAHSPGPARMAEGADGSIYSTTSIGGKYTRGTVYKVTPAGKVIVLYDFDGGLNGGHPKSGLTRGRDGGFYGTTYSGGEKKVGTIFRIRADGGTPAILYSFRNGWLPKLPPGKKYSEQEILDAAGSYPVSAPVQATDGNFYGVTSYANNQKWGVLYRIGSGGFRALYKFDGRAGNFPGVLVAGADGNLYGTTHAGNTKTHTFGTVFKATTGGGVSTLHEFSLATGAPPTTLIYGKDGNLYGTTSDGGLGRNGGNGVIFKIPLDGSGGYTVLHQLDGRGEGSTPIAALVEGPDDLLYGASCHGGRRNGVLYRLGRDGTQFSVVDPFVYKIGHSPMGALLLHSMGNIYGTAYQGGTHGYGSIYSVQLCPLVGRFGQPVYDYKNSRSWIDDPLLEIRTGVIATQGDTRTSDGITITVKCWRDPHIVQFIYREQIFEDGTPQEGFYPMKNHDDETKPLRFRLTTNPRNAHWRHDSLRKPNPYYESSMSYRNDCDSLTTFDSPTLNFKDDGTYKLWRATAMVFVICDGKVVRQFRWTITRKDSGYPLYDVSQPTEPNDQDIAFFKVQTAADRYNPWP